MGGACFHTVNELRSFCSLHELDADLLKLAAHYCSVGHVMEKKSEEKIIKTREKGRNEQVVMTA